MLGDKSDFAWQSSLQQRQGYSCKDIKFCKAYDHRGMVKLAENGKFESRGTEE